MKRLVGTILISVLGLAAYGTCGITYAEVYPSRNLTIVVPYPAGGVVDITARLLADDVRATGDR